MKELLCKLKKAYWVTYATESVINGDPWVSIFSHAISQRTAVNVNPAYSLTNVVVIVALATFSHTMRDTACHQSGSHLHGTYFQLKRGIIQLWIPPGKNSPFTLKPDVLSLTVTPNPRQFISCLVTTDGDCDPIIDVLQDSTAQSNYLR